MKVSSIHNFYFYLILGKIIMSFYPHFVSADEEDSYNSSFIVNLCDGKFWMCSGAYIDTNWVVTTAACAWIAKMSVRMVAVASQETTNCQHGDMRQIHSVQLYTMQHYNLDSEIGLIELVEPFELKPSIGVISISDEVPVVEKCILFGTWLANRNLENAPIDQLVSAVVPTEHCLQYYDIDEPEYFICLSKVADTEVWNFPVVCADNLEAFVVADDGALIIGMRLIIYLDWIGNITGPMEQFRSAFPKNTNQGAVTHPYLALCTFCLFYAIFKDK